jgi:hypothetical protein
MVRPPTNPPNDKVVLTSLLPSAQAVIKLIVRVTVKETPDRIMAKAVVDLTTVKVADGLTMAKAVVDPVITKGILDLAITKVAVDPITARAVADLAITRETPDRIMVKAVVDPITARVVDGLIMAKAVVDPTTGVAIGLVVDSVQVGLVVVADPALVVVGPVVTGHARISLPAGKDHVLQKAKPESLNPTIQNSR